MADCPAPGEPQLTHRDPPEVGGINTTIGLGAGGGALMREPHRAGRCCESCAGTRPRAVRWPPEMMSRAWSPLTAHLQPEGNTQLQGRRALFKATATSIPQCPSRSPSPMPGKFCVHTGVAPEVWGDNTIPWASAPPPQDNTVAQTYIKIYVLNHHNMTTRLKLMGVA